MFTLVCDYLPTGDVAPLNPCEEGEACSNCPETHLFCNDGLCSKSGKKQKPYCKYCCMLQQTPPSKDGHFICSKNPADVLIWGDSF